MGGWVVVAWTGKVVVVEAVAIYTHSRSDESAAWVPVCLPLSAFCTSSLGKTLIREARTALVPCERTVHEIGTRIGAAERTAADRHLRKRCTYTPIEQGVPASFPDYQLRSILFCYCAAVCWLLLLLIAAVDVTRQRLAQG